MPFNHHLFDGKKKTHNFTQDTLQNRIYHTTYICHHHLHQFHHLRLHHTHPIEIPLIGP